MILGEGKNYHLFFFLFFLFFKLELDLFVFAHNVLVFSIVFNDSDHLGLFMVKIFEFRRRTSMCFCSRSHFSFSRSIRSEFSIEFFSIGQRWSVKVEKLRVWLPKLYKFKAKV